MTMTIKLWGVRGSLPTPLTPETIEKRIKGIALEAIQQGISSETQLDEFLSTLPYCRYGGFGGHTSCVEVSTDKQTLIIDAGSGLRPLGEKLLTTPLGKGKGEAHIFFTHFHWDHTNGLPFFTPIFIPGNTIHMYSVEDDMEEIIRSLFRKPCFPVPFEALGAKIVFHKIEPRKAFKLGDLSMTPYKLDHPDPCWGFRVENGKSALAYCVDTEAKRTTVEDLAEDHGLYKGADAMIFDAQYTIAESTKRIDWGHAAAAYGLDVAMREGIKNVYFVHHDPGANDDAIAEAETQAKMYHDTLMKAGARTGEKFPEVTWHFAREGTEIALD